MKIVIESWNTKSKKLLLSVLSLNKKGSTDYKVKSFYCVLYRVYKTPANLWNTMFLEFAWFTELIDPKRA
jgi:hypothetical protein